MTNLQINSQKNNLQTKKVYDLEERTFKFAENVINAVKKLNINAVNSRIIDQIVGSSSSIGANYSEANEAESKQDFIHKISICKKEAKETKYWLKILKVSNPEISNLLDAMEKECQEFIFIFSSIIKTSKSKSVLKIEN